MLRVEEFKCLKNLKENQLVWYRREIQNSRIEWMQVTYLTRINDHMSQVIRKLGPHDYKKMNVFTKNLYEQKLDTLE